MERETGYKIIRSLVDLIVWQEAHQLVLETYIVTKKFPRDELFALTSQMRRAVISITSNIAEGFSRKSKKEKIQFYTIAKGSLTELESQFFAARDIGYMNISEFEDISKRVNSVHRLLSAFIKSTSNL